jgi:hypothetical protein
MNIDDDSTPFWRGCGALSPYDVTPYPLDVAHIHDDIMLNVI